MSSVGRCTYYTCPSSKRKKIEMNSDKSHETIGQECPVCHVIIVDGSDKSILSCGHSFHVGCLFNDGIRNYLYCPICKKHPLIPKSADGSITRHPLHFGDDLRTEDLISKRISIINKVHMMEIKSSNAMKTLGASNDNGKGRSDGLNMLSLRTMFENKELKERKLEKQYGPITSNNGIMSSIAYYVMRAADSDDIPISSVDPRKMIAKQTPSAAMVDAYGIDSRNIIKHNVTLSNLFDNGYNMDDLIVFGFTWYDVLKSGLNPKILSESKKHIMPIRDMVNVWKISIHDIFCDVCKKDFDYLASVGLTRSEFSELGATAGLLIKMGLTIKYMTVFDELSMEDWTELGLTFDMLKTDLKAKTSDITSTLMWVENEEDALEFKKYFNFGHENLDIQKSNQKEIEVNLQINTTPVPEPDKVDHKEKRPQIMVQKKSKEDILNLIREMSQANT